MKKNALIIVFCLLMFHLKSHAQSGYVEGRYYQQTYTISDVPAGPTYYKYYYGQIIGVFQMWQHAQWDSKSGASYVYVWGPNGWEYVYVTGTYYWFNWTVYERKVG